MSQKVVTAIVVLVVLVGGVLLLTKNSNKNLSTDIKVAADVPLSGDLAIYGESIRDGAELAKADLKAKNLLARDIIFDWQDNRGEVKDSVSVMQKQYVTPPDIYLSALKPQVAAITDQVSAKGTPHFTWILDTIINPRSNNNLRVWVNFKKESDVFLSYTKTKKIQKVAIMYAHTEASDEEYKNLVAPGLKGQGVKDVLIEPFNLDRTDFKDIAVKFKSFNPDLVIINGFVPHIVKTVQQFRDLGVIKDDNTLASLDMLDASALLSAEELEGIIVAAPLYLTRPDTGGLIDWKESFKKKYGYEPNYHSAYAYDMVYVINDTAKRLTLPASSKEWIDAFRKTNIKGITGDISFDQDGSSIVSMEPAVYRSGKLVPLENTGQ